MSRVIAHSAVIERHLTVHQDKIEAACWSIPPPCPAPAGHAQSQSAVHVRAQLRPLLAPKNHNCDFPAREVVVEARPTRQISADWRFNSYALAPGDDQTGISWVSERSVS